MLFLPLGTQQHFTYEDIFNVRKGQRRYTSGLCSLEFNLYTLTKIRVQYTYTVEYTSPERFLSSLIQDSKV